MNVLTQSVSSFGCSTLQPEEGNSVPVLTSWPAYICSQHFMFMSHYESDLYTSVLFFLLYTLKVQKIGVSIYLFIFLRKKLILLFRYNVITTATIRKQTETGRQDKYVTT